MDIRVLQYFLMVAREQSITKAAVALNMTQPPLSRQLRELEEELGKQLFIRGSRKITLTEEGMILRKRAEEILELVRKAESEISLADEAVAGDVTVGAGETEGMRFLIKAAKVLQKEYPLVHFHIHSGDSPTVMEELEHGLSDFGLLFGEIDTTIYNRLNIPCTDRFGILLRCDSELAEKELLAPEDMWDKPLIVSRQTLKDGNLSAILARNTHELNIVGTYNLLYNASLMVEEGMGYAVGLSGIINVTGSSRLCFRPISTGFDSSLSLVWKKYQRLSRAAEAFLHVLSGFA